MKYFLVPALAALSSGCVAVDAYVDRGTQAAKRAKDTEARVLLDSTCAISVGAYWRLQSQEERAGIALICGGGDTVSTFVLTQPGR